jgi:hypothetical protein
MAADAQARDGGARVTLSVLSVRAQDAVSAVNLDPAARYGFYYADGPFANLDAVRARCPHALLQSITVLGGDADNCDSETGDLPIAQTIAWVERRLAARAYRPGVYANRDRWINLGMIDALARYGTRIKRWQADFDGIAEIPAGFDAKQYATGLVDQDICLETFFDTKPTAPPDAHGKVRLELTHDLSDEGWTHHALPGLHAGFGTEESWDSIELQVCRGGKRAGQWRVHPLGRNAPPLGGNR